MGSVLNTTFHLFNYGDALVNFELSCFNRSFKKDPIIITPITGEVKQKDKTKIDIEIHANSIGENEMTVMYTDKLENAIWDQRESQNIFKINYKCEIFTIMVC